ncbi:transmembrane protein 131-like isoform X2 [Acipenser ruthenus]|uniref:transmembrane protein 131-like isoform X2 n=1 Tax=Acipenser ruthenus TaxID=7906 RepID=UPI002741BECD|nr:transmembrane protein 131-like isoform X2 [Acipenser ruthenus]
MQQAAERSAVQGGSLISYAHFPHTLIFSQRGRARQRQKAVSKNSMAGLRDVQHGSYCYEKTWIQLLLGSLLQLILHCFHEGEAQLQALTQMSSMVEVWQAEEVGILFPIQAEAEKSTEDLLQEEGSSFTVPSGRALYFQPSVLDFGTQLVGLPRAETVYVHNPSQELPVTLISMFTSSRHFHMPSFQRRVIRPRGKTSFRVIFLPTEEGNVENSLFINTSSHGVLSYQIFGVGVSSGASNLVQKKPSVLIFPHIQSIQLTQTQEDASDTRIVVLQLECSLLNKSNKYSQGFSFVRDKKPVVQISLSEKREKHEEFEKLKQYILEHISVLLVIPTGEPKINIYILNSGAKHLYVKEIQIVSKTESTVEFEPLPLSASAANFTHVASVVCKANSRDNKNKCLSQISMQVLKGSYTLKTYPAFLITDGSGYEPPTLFHMKQKQNGRELLDIWMTNGFDFSFTVNDVIRPHEVEGLFKILNFSGPVTLPPGCWKVFSLQFTARDAPVNVMTSLVLVTSAGFSLEMPLQISSTMSEQGDLIIEASAECDTQCLLGMPATAGPQWQKSLLLDSSTWKVDIGLATELCDMWQNRKNLKTCSWPRLPMESGVTMDFGATLVNDSKMKHFTLKNPLASPITVQLLPLSLYPDPLGALDLLTKWFKINPLAVNVTTTEFTLTKNLDTSDNKSMTGERVQQINLQPWETKEIGVIFTPAEHKTVTSIILIRNNLTVFDMVTVKGLGAREMLRVGGKLPGPGASLRFNFPQSTLMECRNGLKNNKPPYVIQKTFKVENAGELPLKVISMNINGYKCQGFGFEVLECHSFQMDYNSSREISIAFTPDFTSSRVFRDLTLVTGRGSLFSFTLNVTLPHHMLPLCAQVVPGPSWEENFWVVTIIVTCVSLFGVCWMACYQARYILTEFSTPGTRHNHDSALTQDNSPVDTVSSSSARITGSCKTFVDSCSTSDKGKGKGSPAVANGPNRNQNGSKKNSGTPAQPQKKHKVSVYYSKYKVNPIATVATAAEEECLPMKEMDSLGDYMDQDTTTCNNNTDEDTALPEKSAQCIKDPYQSAEDEGEVAACLVPMETHSKHNENLTETIGSRPDLYTCNSEEKPLNNQVTRIQQCSNFFPFMEKKAWEKVDASTAELREDAQLKKKPQERVEFNTTAANGKARRNSGKNRRKVAVIVGVPEHTVAVSTEKNRDLERKESRNFNRSRNRCLNGKQEAVKSCPKLDSPLKQMQNAVCLANPRRKCLDRRLFSDSGSDSGSSSGSVRASRGSWGSWSSLDGEKDHNITKLHCTTSTAKRENIQNGVFPADRGCCPTPNPNYSLLYQMEKTQMPETVPATNFTPSFAAVAAGVERNTGVSSPYQTEEMWSAPSVPLTTDFRYSPPESLPCIPQGSIYNGFPWTVNSQCAIPYPYCEQSSYYPVLDENVHFQNAFPGQETQSLPYAPQPYAPQPYAPQPYAPQPCAPQPCWNEEETQGITSAWESTGCVGSKPYFSGTRSLSPMSSLFGSIWTPKSDPYQSQFQHNRSLSHSSVSKEQSVICKQKQFSSFDPFRCHMNLDIWNSSSSRSTNSQLSSDSGYCGDV